MALCRLTSLVVGLAALLLFTSAGRAADWEKVGGQGMMQFVLVSKAKEADRPTHQAAIKALCRAGKFCFLLFWSEREMVPRRIPMTDAEAHAQTASYSHNPTNGFTQFLWNCRLYPDPNECFR